MFAKVYAVPLLLLCTLIFFVSSGLGQQGGQPPGGGDGKKGKGGGKDFKKGGMGMDPIEFFKSMSEGKDYIMIADVPFDKLKQPLADFALAKGITNGKITLDQYKQFSDEARAAARAANPDFFKKKKDGGGGPPGPGGPPNGFPMVKQPPPKPAEKTDDEWKKLAEEKFKMLDTNGDGILIYEEMDDLLKKELFHWDKDMSGDINLEEYIPYYIDTAKKGEQNATAEVARGSTPAPVEDSLDVRTPVFRIGALPKELPPWFEKLDTNKDGFVSLGEWYEAKKQFDEFKAIDRNNDGLLSPEEVLRFVYGENYVPFDVTASTNNVPSVTQKSGPAGNAQTGKPEVTDPFAKALMKAFGKGQGQGGQGKDWSAMRPGGQPQQPGQDPTTPGVGRPDRGQGADQTGGKGGGKKGNGGKKGDGKTAPMP